MGKKGAAAVALAVGALAAAGAIIASAGETTSARDGASPARDGASSARNGKISFDKFFARAEQGDIHAVAPDGSGRIALVRSRADETESAWSPDGTRFAFARIVGFGKSGIFIRNADGTGERVLLGTGRFHLGPSWSPDGSRIAFYSDRAFPAPKSQDDPPPPHELFTINVDGTDLRRITDDRHNDYDPVWSRDGNTLYFTSDRDATERSPLNAYSVPAAGGPVRRLTPKGGRMEWNPQVSPDGRTIAIESAAGAGKQSDLYRMNADGTGMRPLLRGPAFETHPIWSPDGTQIAFTSDRHARKRSQERLNARFELYVMNLDGTGIRRLTRDRQPTVFPDWQPLP